MHAITADRERNLLDIRWDSLFTSEEVIAYAQEARTRFDRSGLRPGYRLRIDTSGSSPQTQQALDAFALAFRDFPKASRIAFVTQSAIIRLQIKRVMPQPYLRIFERADAALDWLMAP